MLNFSTPMNTTKCLQFNYSNNTGGCVNDYESCAEQAVCPPENGHHCFVVWNTTAQQLNRTPVISAGCNPAYRDAPDEKCMGDCVGVPKGQKGLFYCCCTGHLCNMKYKLPNMTAVNNNNNNYPNQLLLNNTSSSMIIVALCLYIIWSESSRRRHKLGPTNNIMLTNSHPNTNNNHKRNKNSKIKPNQSDLTELRNNNDISALTPLRNPSRTDDVNHHHHHHNHSNMASNHQLSNPTTNTKANNHMNLHQHHHHVQQNGGDQQRINQQQLNQENHCDQNSPIEAIEKQDEQQQQIDLYSVKLSDLVGIGRYGKVYRATLPDYEAEVAVKILLPAEQQSWLNEKEVYSLNRLKHPNISKLLYADQEPITENYWLIVEYASRGSLSSYLKDNLLDWKDFIHISLGIVHGLSHLHEADVAHRDFKSKNILLKSDLTPCITDFGAAAILDTSAGSQLDHKKKYLQVGTPRYMAPEVLECSVTFTKASFTKIDAYALSLVLWELISRCYPLPTSSQQNYNSELDVYPNMAITGKGYSLPIDYPMHSTMNEKSPLSEDPAMLSSSFGSEQNHTLEQSTPYRLPFEEVAGKNPDINTMRQIVVVDKYRPPIKEEWRLYPASEFCRAIEDGWEYDHDARISASCFVERVESLPKVA